MRGARLFISVLAVAARLSGSMAQTPEEMYKEAGTWLFLEQEAGFGDALARFQALKPESAKKDCLLGLLEGQLLHAMQDARGAAIRLGPVEREARALFGPYTPFHLEALARLAYARGDTGALDAELDTALVLQREYGKDTARNKLELAECLNVIGMNYGKKRGDDLSQVRLQQQGLDLVLRYRPKDQLDSMRWRMQEWTLRNNLALAFVDIGDYENARLFALECKRLLAILKPNVPYESIADMVLGRTYWQMNGDLPCCLAYLDSALKPFPPVAPPWYSYRSFRADVLLQAGENERALTGTSAAIPLVQDTSFRYGGIGEASMKLLLSHGHALLRNGKVAEAAEAVRRARAHLHEIQVQAGVLALLVSELDLLVRDAQGQAQSADRLVDSVLTRYADAGSASAEGVAYNRMYVRACTRFGAHWLQRALGEGAPAERTRLLGRAVEQLREAVRMDEANRTLFFSESATDLVAHGALDPVGLLLRTYAACTDEAASLAPPEAIAAALNGSKSALLERDAHLEDLYTATLATAENDRRLDLRAQVYAAFNGYLNEPGPATAGPLQDARTAHGVYLRELRAKYPGLATPPPPAACDALAECARYDAVMLDYYLTDSVLYAQRTTGTDRVFFHRRVPAEFLESLARYRAEALDPVRWLNDQLPSAEVLALPRNWKSWLLDGILEGTALPPVLIVVPHRELGLINFEMLPVRGDTGRYLIEDSEVRYLLSGNMLCLRSALALDGEVRLAGFSASTFLPSAASGPEMRELASRGGPGGLKGTEEETEAITSLYGGHHFPHAKAAEFLANTGQYDMLHVGAHGFAYQDGSGNAYLLFEGTGQDRDRVTRGQISGLKLPCELTVLSACNTGTGALSGGEGSASLSRAFFRAGSRSVVSSLWQVPDARTSGIMTAFYRYMKEGMPRGAALRRAKLDHLARYKGAERLPWFWSGFILTGADDAPPGIARWWWAAVPVLALLGYFAFRRRRSSAAS